VVKSMTHAQTKGVDMSNIIQEIKTHYTSRAKPNRGYHDSEDIITFSGGTEDEQRAVMNNIQKEKAKVNMWSYPPVKVKENTWSINYGFDSGD
jgi:hypothetical protein